MKMTFFCMILLSFFCSCVPGTKEIASSCIKYKEIAADTLSISADQTSLSGHWLMTSDALFFVDYYVPGVKQFDLAGKYIKDCVHRGRGPNEIVNPVVVAAPDTFAASFCFLDSDMTFSIFDTAFERIYRTEVPFFYEFDKGKRNADMQYLLHHPDPQALKMYEYHIESDRMVFRSGRVTLPVETTHVHYNGYETKSRAREVWRNCYVFVSFDCRDISGTAVLWGKYPSLYSKHNIPVFSAPDFCETDTGFLVSFPADPLIYVYDFDGKVIDAFGIARQDIGPDFPETRTLKEYDSGYDKLRRQKGFYGRLYMDGQRLFRQYQTDEGVNGMQIYEGKTLVGDIPLEEPIEILGRKDDVYYAFCHSDAERETFEFLKFTLMQ